MGTNNPYALHLTRFSTHRQIINAIGSGKTVLDVGCNDGYIGAHASTNEFYGLDYMPESVVLAKKIYKDAIVYDLNTLTPLPWKKQFDVMIFADVLEHVVHPKDALSYLVSNYASDGATVIISLPNIANWKVRLSLLAGRFNYTDSGILDRTHLHFYTYKTARELVRAADLRIIEQHAGASFFGPIAAAFPFLKCLLASSIIIYAEKSSKP